MQQKDYSFDYVRTIATFIIISGHFNLYCSGNSGLGRLLGGAVSFFSFFCRLYCLAQNGVIMINNHLMGSYS